MSASLLARLCADVNLDAAYRWLCQRRRDYHHNDDVWWLRHGWPQHKARIQQQLRAGTYRLGPLNVRRHPAGGEDSLLWDAADALVLRALSQVLADVLVPRLSRHCYHLAGRGGMRAAVQRLSTALPHHDYVFRTDVKGYYAHIGHTQLLSMLAPRVNDPAVMALLEQAVIVTLCQGGNYHTMRRGICRGSPLSPLFGALYLQQLDHAMAGRELVYVRYMDDWVILCRSLGQLRRAVAATNRILVQLGLRQHPDKTFIGRVSRGFEFLGVQFSPQGLTVAAKTLQRCAVNIARLYEQGADHVRVGAYWQRWHLITMPLIYSTRII